MFAETSALWRDTQATDLYSLSLELGPEEAAARMHTHWETWFTEADFEAMAATYGVNHIRIPMGEWVVLFSIMHMDEGFHPLCDR
jgi:glucan 1,3-beta-glucosidase